MYKDEYFSTSAKWYTAGVLEYVKEKASGELGFNQTLTRQFSEHIKNHPDEFMDRFLIPGAIEFGKRWRSEHSE